MAIKTFSSEAPVYSTRRPGRFHIVVAQPCVYHPSKTIKLYSLSSVMLVSRPSTQAPGIQGSAVIGLVAIGRTVVCGTVAKDSQYDSSLRLVRSSVRRAHVCE